MKIEFHATGKPPKKDGANSMWNKATEVPRIIELRQQAYDARKAAEMTGPIASHVRLQLKIRAPQHQIESVGDLDNFITGICDGLQAANPRASLDARFEEEQLQHIHPRIPLLLQNDSTVVEIVARKSPVSGTKEISYSVSLETVHNLQDALSSSHDDQVLICKPS